MFTSIWPFSVLVWHRGSLKGRIATAGRGRVGGYLEPLQGIHLAAQTHMEMIKTPFKWGSSCSIRHYIYIDQKLNLFCLFNTWTKTTQSHNQLWKCNSTEAKLNIWTCLIFVSFLFLNSHNIISLLLTGGFSSSSSFLHHQTENRELTWAAEGSRALQPPSNDPICFCRFPWCYKPVSTCSPVSGSASGPPRLNQRSRGSLRNNNPFRNTQMYRNYNYEK